MWNCTRFRHPFVGQLQLVEFRATTICRLSSLKLNSQVFEEDALQWEEKLNRIHDVFDVWIDVQRRWVYLDGIFSGSADIKALLPVETQRFQRWVKVGALRATPDWLQIRRVNADTKLSQALENLGSKN